MSDDPELVKAYAEYRQQVAAVRRAVRRGRRPRRRLTADEIATLIVRGLKAWMTRQVPRSPAD